MWIYEKRLIYPLGDIRPNPRMAKLTAMLLGGPNGEFTAATTYLNQRYCMPCGAVQAILTDIGTEELSPVSYTHLAVYKRQGLPRYGGNRKFLHRGDKVENFRDRRVHGNAQGRLRQMCIRDSCFTGAAKGEGKRLTRVVNGAGFRGRGYNDCRFFARSGNPVSYTHLDVYKRQKLYRRNQKSAEKLGKFARDSDGLSS